MTCPICKNNDAVTNGQDVVNVDCMHCGQYSLTGSLLASLPHLLEKSDTAPKLSHVLRKTYEAGKQLMLTSYIAESILDNPLPRPREQADLLIQWLARNSQGPGEPIQLSFLKQGAVVGAKSNAGLLLILDYLKKSELVDGSYNAFADGTVFANIFLTFEGWEHYESLRIGAVSYRKAFMAMKFGEEALNNMLDTVFRPSAKRAGFELTKLDDIPKAGLIDDRLRVEIRAADFVIADLTHDNLGAYWEAGYAEGLGKPVIYTCERSKFGESRTHFDTNHHLTIVWDMAEPQFAADQLTQTIRATLPHLATLIDD